MDENRIRDMGLICTKKGEGLVYLDNQRCLEEICCGLGDAADGYPYDVYAEAKGGSKSAKAGAAMAMAQGVMIGTLAPSHNITLMLPQKVKQIVCGDRKASKDDIRTAVDELYPEAFEMMVSRGFKAKKYNEHIYDAIAIGWAINKDKNG
jgi:Holliday junction resolvasome RuvABC endonuclease subunit